MGGCELPLPEFNAWFRPTVDLGGDSLLIPTSLPVTIVVAVAGGEMELTTSRSLPDFPVTAGRFVIPPGYSDYFRIEPADGVRLLGPAPDDFRTGDPVRIPDPASVPATLLDGAWDIRIDPIHSPHPLRISPLRHVPLPPAGFYRQGEERGGLRIEDTFSEERLQTNMGFRYSRRLRFRTWREGWSLTAAPDDRPEVLYTRDGGKNWWRSDLLTELGITDLFFLDSLLGFAVRIDTGRGENEGMVGLTLFETRDGGDSFVEVHIEAPDLTIAPAVRGGICAVGENCIILGKDYRHIRLIREETGRWRRELFNEGAVAVGTADRRNGLVILGDNAGQGDDVGGNGLHRSTDGGRTWHPLLRELSATNICVLDTTTFAVLGMDHLLLTRDGGRSWRYGALRGTDSASRLVERFSQQQLVWGNPFEWIGIPRPQTFFAGPDRILFIRRNDRGREDIFEVDLAQWRE